MTTIPHRGPFLFVSEQVREEGGSVIVLARFPADNPYVADGSDDPVVPQLIVVEALAQAVALAADRAYDKTKLGVLVMLRNITFSGEVRVSETLELHVRHARTHGRLVRYETRAVVASRTVCQGEITAAHLGDA